MPGLRIPDGFAQVTMHGDCAEVDGEVINVFGVNKSAVVTDLATLAGAIAGEWMDDFADFFWNGYTLVRVTVAEAVGGEIGEWTGSLSGTVGGDGAPPNTAALAKKVTGLSGKKNRGRIYFGCLPEAYTLNANLTASGLTQLQAGCDAFIPGLEALDAPMVILHTSNATPTPVVELQAEFRLATQRGRLRD